LEENIRQLLRNLGPLLRSLKRGFHHDGKHHNGRHK
jgi:hypothetical protein